MIFGHDLSFWLAIAGATALKVVTSPFHSVPKALVTVFAAVFSAYFFTDAVLDHMQWDPEVYRNPVAALLALTGEGFMRFVLQVLNDPARFLALVKAWRAGK